MKTIFDLSLLDGILSDIPNSQELETKIKEQIKKRTHDASNRERFFEISISGNTSSDYEFEFLNCYIALHLKRIYSSKTWRPIKDTYTVEAYKIYHLERKTTWEKFRVTEYKRILVPLSDIEEVDTEGNRI